MVLSPAGFANLKRILAKVAHTNPGALFKVQKKGTKTAATPFSNSWFSSTFTLGSMFLLEDVCVHNNGILEVSTSRSTTSSSNSSNNNTTIISM